MELFEWVVIIELMLLLAFQVTLVGEERERFALLAEGVSKIKNIELEMAVKHSEQVKIVADMIVASHQAQGEETRREIRLLRGQLRTES